MAEITDTTSERWLPIPGYEGMYDASNLGRIRSHPKKTRFGTRIIKPCVNRGGYLYVLLCKSGTIKQFTIHRLVMMAFVGLRPLGHHIDHIDFDRANNRIENLRYVSPMENVVHSQDRIYAKRCLGEKHGGSKLKVADVIEIRKLIASGISQSKIASKFGVRQTSICKINTGKRWSHV